MFISLPEFVLVRCCLDEVSMSRVLNFTLISGMDVVSFGTQNVSFGMFFASTASTLAPWGTIVKTRVPWEHKKGDFVVQVWVSVD